MLTLSLCLKFKQLFKKYNHKKYEIVCHGFSSNLYELLLQNTVCLHLAYLASKTLYFRVAPYFQFAGQLGRRLICQRGRERVYGGADGAGNRDESNQRAEGGLIRRSLSAFAAKTPTCKFSKTALPVERSGIFRLN
jgi:hypothetical protein